MIKDYESKNIRNVAILGHNGTGKTTLTESLLYSSGAISEMGNTEKGTTVSDFDSEEKKRKISIHNSIAFMEHKNKKINVIDTPGLSDFLVEVKCALTVSESALLLVDAESGIEMGTLKNWDYCDEIKIGRMVFVNKMDKERANFDQVVSSLEDKFGLPTVLLSYPVGSGDSFKGVIDLISKKMVIPDGKKVKLEDVPADLKDKVEELRASMVEAACGTDDELIEKFLNEEEITNEEIYKGIQKGLIDSTVIPVLCGASLNAIGSHLLLDYIINTCPSPLDKPDYIAFKPGSEEPIEKKIREDDLFSGYVFKTLIDQYAGKFSFFKVFSGRVSTNDEILDMKNQNKEKASHIYALQGNKKTEVPYITAGDIGAFVKLDSIHSDETICSADNQVIIKGVEIPQPVSFSAVSGVNRDDDEKLNEQLYKLAEEDLGFSVEFDSETKETVLKSMGEMQTDINLDIIRHRIGIEIDKRTPKIAYKETIKKKASARYKHKKQSGGHGQYGECEIEVEPLPKGGDFEFVDDIFGGAIPKTYIPGVEKGVKEAMEEGVVAGYPVCDIKVRLYDGSYHSVDSNEHSFKVAGRYAMRHAMEKASPVLLEPVMHVKVFVSDSLMGAVMNDLNSKRARVQGMNKYKDDIQVIEADVPLSEMLRYSIDLKAITSGAGTFEMQFSHYEELTGRLADKVVEDRKREKEEEN